MPLAIDSAPTTASEALPSCEAWLKHLKVPIAAARAELAKSQAPSKRNFGASLRKRGKRLQVPGLLFLRV